MNRYLLIDDDDIVNIIHHEIISQFDPSADIVLFNSSLEGLAYLEALLQANKALPDFIFLDIRMPQLDGFGVLDRLGAYPPERFMHTALYMLTSSLDDRDRAKAHHSPLVTGFRSKTLTSEMLLEIQQQRP